MIDAERLGRLMPAYLPRQRWYGEGERPVTDVRVAAFEVWHDEWPGLVWGLVDTTIDGAETVRFQVFVGLRSVDHYEHFLDGKGRSLLGDVATDAGEALAYDAFADPALARLVLDHVAPGLEAHTMRPLPVEQSNTSVVFDERHIMKVFRRINPGPNPDVEVGQALDGIGYPHVPRTEAVFRHGGDDLAVVRRFLIGATDGFVLAQTSLRDLYDARVLPAEAGGDFAPDARRLGEVTATLHAALADAFGLRTATPRQWAQELMAETARVAVPGVDRDDLAARYQAVAGVTDGGSAIRIHGDYHLGQILRADTGWFVLDFEGEPARPASERRRPGSPLRDVAGMLRSFQYATHTVLAERGEDHDLDQLRELAGAWERRARAAFLDGYYADRAVTALLPARPADRDALLAAFELGKAVYEVGYERRHRPDWEAIPVEAVRRIVVGGVQRTATP